MARFRFRAMGSPCALELEASPGQRIDLDAAAGALRDEVDRLERKYSRYRNDSLTSRINASAGSGEWISLDTETAGLLDYAQTAWRESEGLFDLSSGVLRRAWDFAAGIVPEAAAVEALMARVGWSRLEWSPPRLRLPLAGMELDFGGLVKEYAVDCAVGIAREQGVAHGWVDLGGDIGVIGPPPGGGAWRIGLRNPAGAGALCVLQVEAGAVASSGNYERMIERDGRRYGHILDPRSGWPVEGAVAVSVLSGHCLLAGTSATIAMLSGARAADWLEGLGLPYLLVGDDGVPHGPLVSAT